jgi:hypothetical protein
MKPEDLEIMSVKELRAVAEENGLDIPADVKKKADIVAFVKKGLFKGKPVTPGKPPVTPPPTPPAYGKPPENGINPPPDHETPMSLVNEIVKAVRAKSDTANPALGRKVLEEELKARGMTMADWVALRRKK